MKSTIKLQQFEATDLVDSIAVRMAPQECLAKENIRPGRARTAPCKIRLEYCCLYEFGILLRF